MPMDLLIFFVKLATALAELAKSATRPVATDRSSVAATRLHARETARLEAHPLPMGANAPEKPPHL